MLSKELIRKLAKLARLQVEETEVDPLLRDLNSILGYIQQLDKVDVSTVAPLSQVNGLTNVFRNDLIADPLSAEDSLRNAPDLSGRYIRVPLIVEE